MTIPFNPLGDWVNAFLDPRGRSAAPAPAAPAAALGDVGDHRVPTDLGPRDYLLFTPAARSARPTILLMLHGCGQDAASFARATRMNELAGAMGAFVIWPEQPISANSLRCWNWHEPDHQTADRGEAAMLMALVRHVAQENRLRAADVFVVGMSAGGAMAAVMAELYPRAIRAVGIHSGLPFAAAASVSEALTAMRRGAAPARDSGVPMILFHGDADEVVSPTNGAALAAHIGGRLVRGGRAGQHRWSRRQGPAGEYWLIHGMGHDWSGGSADVDHTDPRGPDASAEMMRFFWHHRRPPAGGTRAAEAAPARQKR